MEDSDNLQTNKEVKINKKSGLGKTLTKTALVIGTASVITYSLVKDKILGNPRSKIRKGLFYATIAGVILYKCQGEKVAEVYDSAKADIKEAYGNLYEIKWRENAELNRIRLEYDALCMKNTELENKMIDYLGKDYALESMAKSINELSATKDSLRSIMEKNAAEKDSLEKLIRVHISENKKLVQLRDDKLKSIDKINASVLPDEKIKFGAVETAESVYGDKSGFSYLQPFKLVQIKGSDGKYLFKECSDSFSNDDFVWTISADASNLDDVSESYYGNREFAGVIAKFNRDRLAVSERKFYPGVPIVLIESGLVNSSNIYRGKLPRYSLFETGISLECALNYVYPEESKKIDVDSAIRMYNRMYGLDVNKEREAAKISGSKYYSVLIPDFLKAWKVVAIKNGDENGN